MFLSPYQCALKLIVVRSDGVLSNPSGELVIKPCKQSEIDFYESTSEHPAILPYIPTFLGTITLGSETIATQAGTALVLPSEVNLDPPVGSGIGSTTVITNDWSPSNGAKIQTDLAIVLENIAHGFKKPNILDVKLGARLWAEDAPIAKRVKLDKVAGETTSGSLGFRIAGMKTYHQNLGNGHDGELAGGYKLFDKEYGRSFSAENVDEGFGDYFLLGKEETARGPIRKVIKRFIDDLKSMQEVIEKGESRMYSASLLFVYEGDRPSLQDAFITEADVLDSLDQKRLDDKSYANGDGMVSNGEDEDDEDADDDADEARLPAIQSLKLIDFAHAEWTPGQGPDENLLNGIRNVIQILHGLA